MKAGKNKKWTTASIRAAALAMLPDEVRPFVIGVEVDRAWVEEPISPENSDIEIQFKYPVAGCTCDDARYIRDNLATLEQDVVCLYLDEDSHTEEYADWDADADEQEPIKLPKVTKSTPRYKKPVPVVKSTDVVKTRCETISTKRINEEWEESICKVRMTRREMQAMRDRTARGEYGMRKGKGEGLAKYISHVTIHSLDKRDTTGDLLVTCAKYGNYAILADFFSI